MLDYLGMATDKDPHIEAQRLLRAVTVACQSGGLSQAVGELKKIAPPIKLYEKLGEMFKDNPAAAAVLCEACLREAFLRKVPGSRDFSRTVCAAWMAHSPDVTVAFETHMDVLESVCAELPDVAQRNMPTVESGWNFGDILKSSAGTGLPALTADRLDALTAAVASMAVRRDMGDGSGVAVAVAMQSFPKGSSVGISSLTTLVSTSRTSVVRRAAIVSLGTIAQPHIVMATAGVAPHFPRDEAEQLDLCSLFSALSNSSQSFEDRKCLQQWAAGALRLEPVTHDDNRFLHYIVSRLRAEDVAVLRPLLETLAAREPRSIASDAARDALR
jgi:hypothetical protein